MKILPQSDVYIFEIGAQINKQANQSNYNTQARNVTTTVAISLNKYMLCQLLCSDNWTLTSKFLAKILFTEGNKKLSFIVNNNNFLNISIIKIN